MAEYWTNHLNNYLSPKVDSPSKLSGPGNYYAQGDDIEFDSFFSLRSLSKSVCIVYKSNFSLLNLESTSFRIGYESWIVFEECKIEDIKITHLTLQSLTFKACKIGNIEIQDCKPLSIFKLIGENEIKNIKITNSAISQFEIVEGKSLDHIYLSNNVIMSISIKDSLLNKLECFENNRLDDLTIKNCKFEKFFFQENCVNDILSLGKCSGGVLEFNRCKFSVDTIDVNNCSMALNFHKTQAYVKLRFRIKKSESCKMSLNRCYFSEEVSFIGAFEYKEKNFFINDSVFKDLVLFDDDNAKCLVISASLFQKGLLLPIPKINKVSEIDSSVWCILKNQSLSRNDNIKALEFRKNELTAYTNELRIKRTHFQERLVLFFNKVSNNHGINWFLGILFTVFIWLFFYSIFVMSKDNFHGLFHSNSTFLLTDRYFWSDAVSFLWIPQGVSDLSNGLKEHHSWISEFLMTISFVLGKIFIAYGVFQTISAFRRHGKA
jgi:hypothetical protein